MINKQQYFSAKALMLLHYQKSKDSNKSFTAIPTKRASKMLLLITWYKMSTSILKLMITYTCASINVAENGKLLHPANCFYLIIWIKMHIEFPKLNWCFKLHTRQQWTNKRVTEQTSSKWSRLCLEVRYSLHLSATFGLFLALHLKCWTNFLPTTNTNK